METRARATEMAAEPRTCPVADGTGLALEVRASGLSASLAASCGFAEDASFSSLSVPAGPVWTVTEVVVCGATRRNSSGRTTRPATASRTAALAAIAPHCRTGQRQKEREPVDADTPAAASGAASAT